MVVLAVEEGVILMVFQAVEEEVILVEVVEAFQVPRVHQL